MKKYRVHIEFNRTFTGAATGEYKIAQIKLFREIWGLSLLNSKNMVDSLSGYVFYFTMTAEQTKES
jgi:ribosomal protein L7/L12